MAKIEVYSKDYCPYCDKAKALFTSKGAEYVEYDITNDPQKQQEMVSRNPGARTVPQIFINDEVIGGCDDLYALDADGKLDSMLA